MLNMKTPRGTSESSTTSDNTTEFIDIVKKYDVVYNTHNPDYKNVEVKMKVWSQIAEEIGLSVDASKRKWKNLRDSYTKYLRSFRIGTKTSKKYQYWAHADHMEFLKPYQGPGRSSTSSSSSKQHDDEDPESDLGYQVLAKATTSSEDDLKITITTTPPAASQHSTISSGITMCGISSSTISHSSSICTASTTCTTTTTANTTPQTSAALIMPMPSLPTVQLPPQFNGKASAGGSPLGTNSHQSTSTTLPTQIFSIPALSSVVKNSMTTTPVSSSSSGVGCLIIEPHLFAASSSSSSSADTFKKELSTPGFGLFHNIAMQGVTPTTTTSTTKINPPLITKIRRVPASQQHTNEVNLSFSATSNVQPPPKTRKVAEVSPKKLDIDVSAVLQANRDLDANTLFFLSLAKTVRAMPTKFQSLAKMRCMRIVSDIELELENVVDCNGAVIDDENSSNKFPNVDSPPDGSSMTQITAGLHDSATEHFVYVMSPSRVESMIDISSEDENTMNGI